MENIESILKKIGIEIPEEKKSDFDKAFNKNYKTVSEMETVKENLKNANEQLKQRDADLEELKKTMKGLEEGNENAKKLTEQIEALQKKSKEEKEALEKQIESQKYDFAIEKRCAGLKFSSKAGRKAFISDLKEKELKMEDGEILGFDDFVKSYKENDAGVFSEETNGTTPKFGGKSGGEGEGKKPKLRNFY